MSASQLPTPTITAEVFDRTKIRISGLSVANATGYQVKIGTLSGGLPVFQVTPVDGVVEFDKRLPRSVYYIQARALGDDETCFASQWSDEISVLTGQIIDNELEVPQISAATSSYTVIKITGLTALEEYRYKIAATEAALENALPKCIGSKDGTASIMSLEPGTTYFIRFCRVSGTRCSLWSDVVSASTYEVTNTIEVTSGADSGTGTLRAAISAASATGTKILLKVAAITLNSAITDTTKKLFIIGGQSARTVIQPGSSNKCLQLSYADYRFLKFTGNSGSNNLLVYGFLSDCVVEDAVTSVTNSGVISTVSISNCRFSNNKATRGVVASSSINDSVFSGCQTTGNGGAVYGGVLNNSIVTHCYAGAAGGGVYSDNSTLTNCYIANNTAATNGGGVYSGNVVRCVIENNTANYGGGCYSSTVKDSVVTNNTAATNGGGTGLGTITNCRITDNVAPTGGGSYGSYCRGCLIVNNFTPTGARNDWFENQNYGITIYHCTVGTIGGYHWNQNAVYNTLHLNALNANYKATANNIKFGGSESDYFVDAANGDYRLKPGCNAIEGGDNQYVPKQLKTDLAGNPRISGTNVDVGAYEFEPIQLSKPTLDLTAGHGQATISFTLPDYCSGYLIEYADNADFTNASSTTATTTGFVLLGLSGDVYLRSKYLGTSGLTLDSEYSDAVHHYFDVTAPAVVVSREPIEMTCGQAVDLLDGLVVTDDYDQEITPHYQVLDRDNAAVVIDGADTDIPAEAIDVGNYKIVFTASDAAGNTATADRGLAVLPPFLTAPTISLSATSTVITVSGLTTAAAAGFQLRWTVHGAYNWTIGDTVQPAGGSALITELIPGTAYDVQARAIGTDGVSRTSPWSDCVRVITLPESSTPVLGLLGSILGQAARAFEIAALYKRGDQTGTVHVVLEQQEVIDLSGEVYQTRRVQPMTLSLIELREAMGNGFTPKAGDIVVAADQTFRLTDYSGVVTTTQFTVENDRVRIYGVIL